MVRSNAAGVDPVAKENRQSHRFPTKSMTRVTLNGRVIACRLMNISAGGAVVDAILNAPVGTSVILDIPGGDPAPGKVVRVTSSYTALAFEEKIVLPVEL